MKKLFSILLLAAVVVVCAAVMPVEAQVETSGDYTYSISNGQATITDCRASISGNITIPSALGGYPVTSIGTSAFDSCTRLTGVTIPDSVTSIGSMAFYDCINLTSIILPDGVSSIGYSAFSGCDSLTYNEYDNAKYLGNSTNPYLVLVKATSTSIASCIIHTDTRIIAYLAFCGCKGLTSITIPDSVTSIGDSAFAQCTGLTSITIPDSVADIDVNAFMQCYGLTYNKYDNAKYLGNSTNPYLVLVKATSTSITSCTIHTDTRIIADDAFRFCNNLTSVTIPDGVISIGFGAFDGCTNLTSITIPNSVTSIDGYAFYDCENLTSITIPNGVTSIDNDTFYDCKRLTSITIPEGVTSIDSSAFGNCKSLTNITIPGSVTSIAYNAFSDCYMNTVYYGGTVTQWKNLSGRPSADEVIYYNMAGLKITAPSKTTYVEGEELNLAGGMVSGVYKDGSTDQPVYLNNSAVKISGFDNTKAGTQTITIEYFGETTTYQVTVNHSWNGGIVTKKASCKEEGVKTFTCIGCKATKTEDIAKLTTHTYGSWTKVNDTTHKHTCSVCSKEETANHSWNSGSVTQKATCKEAGIKTYICTACNATKTETIAKLTTHTYDHSCDTDCNVCGVTRTTTHDYKTSWSKDKTNHWHECSVCKDKKDIAAHTPGAEATETTAQTCTTCGYVIKAALGHTHKYATTWTTDENGHWYACAGCEEQGSYAEHDFENACDKDCSICGYTRETSHNYSADWESDKDNHWHECAGCGEKADEAAHEPGAEATETTAQTCTTCGYVIKAALGHTHKYATTWTTDENGHWYACSGCEEKGSYAAHDFENACDKDCSICGYTRETSHNYSADWKSDKDNHWHECAGCGEKADEAAHEPGAEATETTPQTCTICGHEIAPALGVKDTEPTTPVMPTEPTTSVAPTEPAGDSEPSADPTVWIIVAVAVVVLGGGAGAGIIIWKKKH